MAPALSSATPPDGLAAGGMTAAVEGDDTPARLDHHGTERGAAGTAGPGSTGGPPSGEPPGQPPFDPGPVRVLGLGGSTRPGSASFALVRAALAMAAAVGAETRAADVGRLDLPLLEEGRAVADYPPAVGRLLAEARAADALLLCSPTYLGTLSGAMKNLLDFFSLLAGDDPPYLGGRPVGLLAFGGANAAHTLTALGHVAHALDALVVPTSVVVPGAAVDRARGAIVDPKIERRLRRMAAEVVDLGGRLRRPGARMAAPLPPRSAGDGDRIG